MTDKPSFFTKTFKMPLKRLLIIPMRQLLMFMFDVQVTGLSNLKKAGERYIIISNHVSLLDAALLTAFLPDKLTFAINTTMAKAWWVKPFLWMVPIYPMDPTQPMAIKALIDLAKKGKKIVIFPEGRITTTGKTMKVYEGPGLIADKADAKILPVYIKGAQYTFFSYLKGKVKVRWFPRIAINILPARTFKADEDLSGHAGRKALANKLYEIMTEMALENQNADQTIFEALLEAKKINGKNLKILDDQSHQPLTYRKLVAKSLTLGKLITKDTKERETIGLLMPNSKANAVAYLGLQAVHHPAAMLNFSAGAQNVLNACKTAKIQHVWTSRQFIEAASLESVISLLLKNRITIHYFEDLKAKVPHPKTILYSIAALFIPNALYKKNRKKVADNIHEKPSTILFTSGSSGTPKGVVLSHKNINTNRIQVLSIFDFNHKDRVVNVLPMFHSFGLTVGVLAPILSGVYTFLYPTPLHYAIIPELIYNVNATIFFGTNTFLQGYTKRADPYDFYSVRYILAGAEKVQESTRQSYTELFGVRILEGYGVTEAAPVISVNSPMYNKFGTVGKPLPGIQCKLEPVDGIERGGNLLVKGDNIMMGYMRLEKPGVIQPPKNGWHDTGDIVEIDEEGYLKIIGRAKRFAKIGGEMVSLAAVEEIASQVWPDEMHACVRKPDAKKGEVIVLATEREEGNLVDIRNFAQRQGISELYIPKVLKTNYRIPLLGSGKPDYMTLEKDLSQ